MLSLILTYHRIALCRSSKAGVVHVVQPSATNCPSSAGSRSLRPGGNALFSLCFSLPHIYIHTHSRSSFLRVSPSLPSFYLLYHFSPSFYVSCIPFSLLRSSQPKTTADRNSLQLPLPSPSIDSTDHRIPSTRLIPSETLFIQQFEFSIRAWLERVVLNGAHQAQQFCISRC